MKIKKSVVRKQLPLGGVAVLMPKLGEPIGHIRVSVRPQKYPTSKSRVGWVLDVAFNLVFKDENGDCRLVNDDCIDEQGRLSLGLANVYVQEPQPEVTTKAGDVRNIMFTVPGSAASQQRIAEYVHNVLQQAMAQITPERLRQVAVNGGG